MAPRSILSACFLSLALASACKDDKSSTATLGPAPEHATASTSAADQPAPTSADLKPSLADTAKADVAPDTRKDAKPAVQGDVALPKATNGVLAAGAADKILATGATPIVKVLDAGSDPKSQLTYALDKGAKVGLEMAMDMTMSIKTGAQALPEVAVPRITMTFDMTTAEKNAQNDAKVDGLLSKVAMATTKGDKQQEQIANAMKDQIAKMKGLSMTYWVSPKGHVHDVKIDTPPGFPPQAQQMIQGMNQSFESMVAPLPAENVGEGAKWQVVTRVASGGADILQYATYTLKSKSGDAVTVDVAITQLAANDQIKAPGMPPNVSAKLKNFSSGGAGKSVLDLKSVAPESGTVDLKSAMDIGVSGGGAGPNDSTSVATKMTVTFSRAKK